jgi:hypothetical protein
MTGRALFSSYLFKPNEARLDDQTRHLNLDHGEITYLVKRYASEGIANALNHLADLHVAERPKDKFDDQ